MIKSMTGYGRGYKLDTGKEITVEVRSVNHRYFDYSSRIPRVYSFLDDKIKSRINETVSRGKLDCFLTVNVIGGPDCEIQINESLLRSYLAALHKICDDYDVRDDISVSNIARYSDIFTVTKQEEDEDAIWGSVKAVLDEALNSFDEMRRIEGEKLYSDLKARCAFIEECVGKIENLSENSVPEYREKLEARLAEMLGDVKVDETRLITETALMADKLSITEETVRLRSHISQFYTMLESVTPIGRKMDFLIQEMNREINTIGSKANNVEIAKFVVDVKSEIERIREQVQNIE